MRSLWHRLLCFLALRDEFDHVPPFAPEVNHPYERDVKLNCCTHCGGGRLHKIHSQPYDARRLAEIQALQGETFTLPHPESNVAGLYTDGCGNYSRVPTSTCNKRV